jgi:hypothetical protein
MDSDAMDTARASVAAAAYILSIETQNILNAKYDYLKTYVDLRYDPYTGERESELLDILILNTITDIVKLREMKNGYVDVAKALIR